MAKQNKQSLILKVRAMFDQDGGVEERPVTVGNKNISIFYVDSLIDKKLFADSILSPIEQLSKQALKTDDVVEDISKVVSVSGMTQTQDEKEIVTKILSGSAVVVTETEAVICPIFGLQARSVTEPPTSRVVKGPREGFVEDLPKNLGLIRKRLKTPNLKIKEVCVGRQSQTSVSIVWLDGIAKPEIVDEV